MANMVCEKVTNEKYFFIYPECAGGRVSTIVYKCTKLFDMLHEVAKMLLKAMLKQKLLFLVFRIRQLN